MQRFIGRILREILARMLFGSYNHVLTKIRADEVVERKQPVVQVQAESSTAKKRRTGNKRKR